MANASDNFNRADSGSLGANWTEATPGFTLASNAAVPINLFTTNAVIWTADAFSNDGFSEITYGGFYSGPLVRGSGSGGTLTYYYGLVHYVLTRIAKVVNGTYTELASNGTTWNAGDIIRLTVTGTSLVLTQNGTSVATATDSDIVSGSPGFTCYPQGPGSSFDNWSGGPIAGGSPLGASSNQIGGVGSIRTIQAGRRGGGLSAEEKRYYSEERAKRRFFVSQIRKAA